MPLRPAVLILQGLWIHYAALWYAGVLNAIALSFIFFASDTMRLWKTAGKSSQPRAETPAKVQATRS